jgi:hypothetical protein
MQETVAKAADTISKIGAVATNVEQAVSDVRRLVLTEQALKSFGGALERFGVLSSDALVVVSNLNALVGTNTMPVTLAVSNLNAFATELSPLASRATLLLSTNVDQISATVQNAEMASVQLTNLMNDLRGPQGLAGRLLNDQKMADDFADMAYYLAIATSNLNHRGLWGIMWRQKDPPPPRTHGSSGTDQ